MTELNMIATPGTSADSYGRGYPRPQLVRTPWYSLNGAWQCAIDRDGTWQAPRDVEWDGEIMVPFSPETPLSRLADSSFFQVIWYHRRMNVPSLVAGTRAILHFGAVDYDATIWVNEELVGCHRGGYTRFSFDITPMLRGRAVATITVRAEDDPHDLAKPRGKQDWQLEPHSIWYPRTTGIWQTVWMELVPESSIGSLRWTPHMARWEIGLEMKLAGVPRNDLRLHVTLRNDNQVIADDTYGIVGGDVHRRIALSDPGIDDYRNDLLWSPESPTLIEAELQLWAGRGELVDQVTSYTALRSIAAQGDRVVLNARPYPLRLVLDQGYWPVGGLTAPNDDALRHDVELAKAMGFNGVRKHQKLEDPRYLYWADKLGLLVWGEMPSAYRFTKESVERVSREWTEAIDRDYSHPSVIAWVPINESWGVPNLPDSPAERHYVQALYHLTRTLDPTRPVIGNDGWESVATDIIGIHDYDHDPERLSRRYRAHDELPRIFRRERPGGRLLVLEGERHAELPIILSEFGGIALSAEQGTWGYSRARTEEEFAARYERLMHAVHSLGMLSGFCYTQFADTYQEANGLLYSDRRPKIPLPRYAAATRGHERAPAPGDIGSAHPTEPHATGTSGDDVPALADRPDARLGP